MLIIHVRRPLSPSPLYLSLFVSCYLFAFYSNLPAILLELMFVYVYEKKNKKLQSASCFCVPPALQQRESRGSVRLLRAAVFRDEKGLQGDDAPAAPVAHSHLCQRQLPGLKRGYRCGSVAHYGSSLCSV